MSHDYYRYITNIEVVSNSVISIALISLLGVCAWHAIPWLPVSWRKHARNIAQLYAAIMLIVVTVASL